VARLNRIGSVGSVDHARGSDFEPIEFLMGELFCENWESKNPDPAGGFFARGVEDLFFQT